MDTNNLTGLEVAVIGIAGKFPGAKDIDSLWKNLVNGKELITFFSNNELENAGIEHDLLIKDNYVKAKGVIDDAEKFDNKYFGYKPKEAQMMDPQIRIMHLCVNDSLENAGYCSHKYDGKIGCFIGANPNYNWEYAVRNSSFISEEEIASASILANKDFISTIIAYNLDLKGPCVTLDCACSTSLVAVDEAVKQLLTGACDMAVAGACAMDSPIKTGYEYQESSIGSPDGHCRPFDKDACGTLNSEGAAAVVLKRLEEAIEDGDKIYAVIKGSAVNNDGGNKVGYTAPSVQGQCDVIQLALNMAEIDSDALSYIETHGTATPFGDMVEIEALTQAFASNKKQFCRIGSIKSNIGHLSAAAGITGFIKAVLCVTNRTIPPSINYKEDNPNIHIERTPFKVNSSLYHYDSNTDNIYVMVSSFGIGGTNACAILTDAPKREKASLNSDIPLIFPLSGTSIDNLNMNIAAFSDYIHLQHTEDLEDIANGLAYGKKDLNYRAAIIADNKTNVRTVINKYLSDGSADDLQVNTVFNGEIEIVFMFGGQGNQYFGMARDLYFNQPVFRQYLDKCFGYIESRIGVRMNEILYSENVDAEIINETFYCQLAVFSLDYAMARFLIGSNIKPSAVIGHSLGEYVAACIAGIFSVEDALDIVIKRAELMQKLERGKMISVILDDENIENYITDDVCISVRNGRKNYVLAGKADAVEVLKERLDEDEIRYRELRTSHAFHSYMVEPILDEFYNFISNIKMNKPKIRMISNITGDWVNENDVMKSDYWIRHLRGTVRFHEGINTLFKFEKAAFIEIGPGNTLTNFVIRNDKKGDGIYVLNTIRNRNFVCNDVTYLYRKMGKLWTLGLNINFGHTYKREIHSKVHLPAHVYELERFYDVYDNIITSKERCSAAKLSKSMIYIPNWEKQENLNMMADDRDCVFVGNHTKMSKKLQNILSGSMPKINIISNLEKVKDFDCGKCLKLVYFCDYEQERVDGDVKHLLPVIRYFEESNKKLEITVITVLGVSIGVGETVYKCEAMLSGFVKAVYTECKYVNARLIDIDTSAVNSVMFRKQLVNDLLERNNFSFIAYRGENRYIEAYASFDEIGEYANNDNQLMQGETYILVGGLGNIGKVICGVLKNKKCKIVILNRSIEITDNAFDSWLATHSELEPHYSKIKFLSGIENVCLLKCDISDLASVMKTAENIKETYGSVSAIINLAGDVSKNNFKRITELDEADFENQFAAKVYGTMYIEKMAELLKPRYCILISSLSTVLGGMGFTAYAAANSFLNQYVYSTHTNENMKWTSLVWDGWDFGDKDVYQYSLSPVEGAIAFEKMLSFGLASQYVIAKGSLGERLEQYTRTYELKDVLNLSIKQETVAIENGDKLKKAMCESIKNYFGIERVDEKDNFFELGATSIDILQIVKIIEKECLVRITPTLFYTYPNIDSLVDSLEDKEEEMPMIRENKLSRIRRNTEGINEKI